MVGEYLNEFLSEFDLFIKDVEVIHGENRLGDIPHSLASIDKAARLLGYKPLFTVKEGLKEAVKWFGRIYKARKIIFVILSISKLMSFAIF